LARRARNSGEAAPGFGIQIVANEVYEKEATDLTAVVTS